MNGRWLTTAAWFAFAAVVGLLAHLTLDACDFGLHPLFALRYCHPQGISELTTERERERDLLDRLHEAQLKINRLAVCLPEPQPREPERRAEIAPTSSPSPTGSPDDQLRVPSELNEINGCWQSIKGDIPVLNDDQEHRIIGHRRICYCFSRDGRGQVRHIILEGGRCVAPLSAQLSKGRLTISHGKIPCAGIPRTLGTWGDMVPGDIVCTKRPDQELASCERFTHGKFPVTFADEVFHRVSTEYCN